MSLPRFLLTYWHGFIDRRHPRETGQTRIRHQRLYIFPTVYGLGFVLIALLLLIGALNYRLSMGFFFAFLLIGIAHAVLLRSYANLLGLQVSTNAATPVFAGEMAYFPILLHNNKRQPRPGILLRAREQNESARCDLQGQSHQLVLLPVQSRQRGKLALPRLTISSSMPLGFFHCWTYVTFDNSVLIYPHVEFNPPPLPEQGLSGDGKKMAHIGNEDFAGLREFQRGDARRDIAWKQSARTGQVLIRQHQTPLGASFWLDFDQLHGLSVEARLSRLTAWILQAEAISRPYGLALPQLKIPPGMGHAHLHRCLVALAEYPGESRRDA
ncbi:DUF58 domain-containing protein [Chitinibacter sp. S2-10]|uniref:DUF58 domain-containing protein n=1 Tax=Chitinibacter sp. S2-10 TaxID=3373597 RepID=UPI003977915E